MKSEPTILSKFGRPVMFVIEREQKKRSEEAKRFWEVKSLEPTFLPKFGRPVMFVIARGMSSVRYRTRLGDLQYSVFSTLKNKQSTES